MKKIDISKEWIIYNPKIFEKNSYTVEKELKIKTILIIKELKLCILTIFIKYTSII